MSSTNSGDLIVGIEGGGTSYKVAIGFSIDHAMENILVTETKSIVNETMEPIKQFLHNKQQELGGTIKRIGIANFGPIDINVGCILPSTPKVSWRNFNIVEYFRKEFPLVTPEHIHFDTDVNGPAMAEYQMVKHLGIKSLAYVTIGTGIGVGLVVNGSTVSGLMHPEAGHIYTPPHQRDVESGFKGFCTFHTEGCLEGMAASPAIVKRRAISIHDVKNLSDDDEIWDIEAHYLAHLCVNLILISSCQVIVMGGGIMNRAILFDKIREKTVKLLNGYHVMVNDESIVNIIKPSIYGEHAGIQGALHLSQL